MTAKPLGTALNICTGATAGLQRSGGTQNGVIVFLLSARSLRRAAKNQTLPVNDEENTRVDGAHHLHKSVDLLEGPTNGLDETEESNS